MSVNTYTTSIFKSSNSIAHMCPAFKFSKIIEVQECWFAFLFLFCMCTWWHVWAVTKVVAIQICFYVLQCVAVCLQCIAVCGRQPWQRTLVVIQVQLWIVACCSVLHFAAVCYRRLQCVAVCCSVLQCSAVCRSLFQCVAVCCSVLQCVAVSLLFLQQHRGNTCRETACQKPARKRRRRHARQLQAPFWRQHA